MSEETRAGDDATRAKEEEAGQAESPRELSDEELKKVSGGAGWESIWGTEDNNLYGTGSGGPNRS